jgi:hypothetical protein
VIDTPQGRGTVTQVDAIKESVYVQLENEVIVEVSHEELQAMAEPPARPPRRQRRRR